MVILILDLKSIVYLFFWIRVQGVLDALNFGFSHTLKSSHFASLAIKLVMEKAKYRA